MSVNVFAPIREILRAIKNVFAISRSKHGSRRPEKFFNHQKTARAPRLGVAVASLSPRSALLKNDFVAALSKDQEEEGEASRGHVVDTVLVPSKPPETLLADFGVCYVDVAVGPRVAVRGTVDVSDFVFFSACFKISSRMH